MKIIITFIITILASAGIFYTTKEGVPMLVLTRSLGQGIVMKLPDGQIVEFILDDKLRHKQIRIKIKADPSTRFLRKELYDAKINLGEEPWEALPGKARKPEETTA